ncbi:DUF6349 family protein [Streptosporangium sp. NPDC002721]|uniref:DUF6349 family protein n=1 Tax=Streptosporangium sp. NPDC002721 TaxID=3366188 RepID=UPI00367F337D
MPTPKPTAPTTRPDPGPDSADTCRVHVRYWCKRDQEQDPPTVRDPGYHLRYRSHCAGCGHDGPIRSGENEAAEDGCDHAYPGWRLMPVLEHRPYEGAPLARWEEAARAAYPPGWFERQGPVREYRNPGLTRHVPGYAPGGGYCMAVMIRQPRRPRSTPATVQGTLFGGVA